MSDLFYEDGWNTDNEDFQDIVTQLDNAVDLKYMLTSCTVASFSTSNDAVADLRSELTAIAEQLLEAAEQLEKYS